MFDNFISLGHFCGTAASLSKHGFRNASYPFDWYHSNFKSIMHFLDTDFSDFLLKDNLVYDPDKPFEFKDIKYDLVLNHEMKYDFDAKYDEIYNKYMCRISRFRADIKNPSCFLRAVRDDNELQYITDSQDYIRQVIKKGNASNEIVFLIPKWIEINEKLSFPYFVLNIESYAVGLRNMFDNNEEIIEFLQENTNASNIVSNLKHDFVLFHEKNYNILRQRYDIAAKLLNKSLDISLLPANIVIYGAGNIGKAFFNKCHKCCNVECFLEENPKANNYRGIPILSWDKVNEIACDNFIITPLYDMPNIENMFAIHCPKANLIPVDTLFVK